MKRILGMVIGLLLMAGLVFAVPGFEASSSAKIMYTSVDETEVFDYAFSLTGPFTFTIDQNVKVNEGVAVGAIPEFGLSYSLLGFTIKETLVNYSKTKLSYSYDALGFVTVNPSMYYKIMLEPDVADEGTYGGAFILTKGSKILPALTASAEIDADYTADWAYVFIGDMAYKFGTDQFVKPYVDYDNNLTTEDATVIVGTDVSFKIGKDIYATPHANVNYDLSETPRAEKLNATAGVEASVFAGGVFDFNYIFIDNEFEISLKLSY